MKDLLWPMSISPWIVISGHHLGNTTRHGKQQRTLPVQETGISVAVEHVDCIDINTGAYGLFPPARNHLVKRGKKNTGAGYLPSAITWIYVRVYLVRLIQPGVIPDSTLQRLQLYSLAMTLPVKTKKMISGIYRLAEAIRDPGPGHLGRFILTGIVLIRTWPGPLSLSMMAHSGMIK